MGARPLHTPIYRRLCALLRKWRNGAGLTQRALALRLKKPPSYVHKTEVGDRSIDPIEFIAWARACGLKPIAALAALEREII
jgi:transcriptional regulator with XRE-family HTH domain